MYSLRLLTLSLLTETNSISKNGFFRERSRLIQYFPACIKMSNGPVTATTAVPSGTRMETFFIVLFYEDKTYRYPKNRLLLAQNQLVKIPGNSNFDKN